MHKKIKRLEPNSITAFNGDDGLNGLVLYATSLSAYVRKLPTDLWSSGHHAVVNFELLW